MVPYEGQVAAKQLPSRGLAALLQDAKGSHNVGGRYVQQVTRLL